MSSELLIWAALCLPLLIAAGIAVTGAFSNVREGVTLVGSTLLLRGWISPSSWSRWVPCSRWSPAACGS
jgi:hypothetical protein